MNNKYLITIEIRDGENEYTEHFITNTDKMEALEKKAQENFLVDNDYRLVKIRMVREILLTAEVKNILDQIGVYEY